MGYEIDFLPVGNASSSGDAIAIRYGDLFGERGDQTVVIIDGGYTDDGEVLVEHVKTHYKTDHIDFVICTHPDRDHIKGLEVVLKELSVGALLIHVPDNHSDDVKASRGMVNKEAALGERLAKSLNDTDSLLDVAREQDVRIVEPFAGMATEDGSLKIIGPTESYYEEQLRKMKGQSLPEKVAAAARSLVFKAQELAFKLVRESIQDENLTEERDESPSNNSSVITLLTVDGHQLLFTGDAGPEAVHKAVDLVEAEGFTPGSLRMIQVPHHGSRHNSTPSMLNRLLGEKGQQEVGLAYVSCAPENPELKRPAKVVLNAFHRRGYPVHQTAGVSKRYKKDAPARDGWSSSPPLPFYEYVELHDE